nr:cyclin-D3-1-like [Ipomoea batatas]
MGTQSSFLLDALYCEEERWGEEMEEAFDETEDSETTTLTTTNETPLLLVPLLLLEQDMFWEDEELLSLFSKEKNTHFLSENLQTDPSLSLERTEAVHWILKVTSHYGFSALTPILAVNYLDRFLSTLDYKKDEPWMIQLAAVTCLSLAAKVEEIHVPLLLDFQVEDAKYVFEAKTIQRMELLVLSTLKWRMNPVTPLSFLDHIIRRLGLKNHLHWEFFRRCECLLLSLIPDSRLVRYLPSVLAASTMLHVIRQVEPCNADHYQNQLLGVLKINQEKVEDCYRVIKDLSNKKRKHNNNVNEDVPSGGPGCVIDPNFSCEESLSDESWGPGGMEPLMKKSRIQESKEGDQSIVFFFCLKNVTCEHVVDPCWLVCADGLESDDDFI